MNLHYVMNLRLTGIKLGLLINFGAPYVKDGVSRIITESYRFLSVFEPLCLLCVFVKF